MIIREKAHIHLLTHVRVWSGRVSTLFLNLVNHLSANVKLLFRQTRQIIDRLGIIMSTRIVPVKSAVQCVLGSLTRATKFIILDF